MKISLFILKNYKAFEEWKKRVKEQPIIDFDRGCGYYLVTGILGYSPIGKIEEIPTFDIERRIFYVCSF